MNPPSDREGEKAMTFGEFKAWLEGFSEGFGEAPNADQWARVKERLGEVKMFPAGGPSLQYPPGIRTGSISVADAS